MKGRGRPPTGRLYDGFGVYTITCLENSKVYVGSSSTVYNRLCNQKCRLRIASSACPPKMLFDFQKFGEAAFKFEIVSHCENKTETLKKEQELIEKYKNTGLLYNSVNAYVERPPKRKEPKKQKRMAINIAVSYHQWLEKKSAELNISRNYFLENLLDSAINGEI